MNDHPTRRLRPGMPRIASCAVALMLVFGAALTGAAGTCVAETIEPGAAPAGARTAAPPLAVKVLIINMFQLEAAPWLAALRPTTKIPVPGLADDYPAVQCNADAICQMTTGMGHANAAASTIALIYSGLFDLRKAYFLIAGIAGIDPQQGTIGSAAWARFAVDSGIAHEIDAREMPRGWRDGYFGIMTDSPSAVPKLEYHTEVYRLDEDLLQRALALSRPAVLEDSEDVAAYRRHYGAAPADRPPAVIQCDTLAGDTWWTGKRLGEHARRWTRLLTGGKGVYCTTQQEDNATLSSLARGAHSGLLDLRRVAIVRSGSDFDRPYARQGALEGLRAQLALPGAVRIAADNLERAGMPLVEEIVRHWDQWQNGVPAAALP